MYAVTAEIFELKKNPKEVKTFMEYFGFKNLSNRA